MTANPLPLCVTLYAVMWIALCALVIHARRKPVPPEPPPPMRVFHARTLYCVTVRKGHDGRLAVIVDPRDNIVLTPHQQQMAKWN